MAAGYTAVSKVSAEYTFLVIHTFTNYHKKNNFWFYATQNA